MSKPIVIVESPNKIKKLKKLMGDRYIFTASVGHIRDLPQREMGVSAPNYVPTYVVSDDKKKVVSELKKLCKGNEVILATDPDREGEAIAWHLAEVLHLRSPKRVTFGEITQATLEKAFAKPRTINDDLVSAYAGRRVLDRLVGFKVSQALSRITGDRYSAGRVQSPALRLVVDREREIEGFNSTTYYGVQAEFTTNNPDWVASWDIKPFLPENEKYLLDRRLADEVATVKEFTVASIESKETQQNPKGAFTTSTLQQAASVALKIKPKETMTIAQQLFADGLITYMRTDSPNLSEEAIESVWGYLKGQGKGDYVPDKPHTYKAKSGSQEAHEAVRPTDFMSVKPDELEGKALALYQLIWERAVASQMKPARFDITTVILKTEKSIDGKAVIFTAKGKVKLFDGWLSLTTDKTEEDKTVSMDDQQLPILSEGQLLTSNQTDVLTKQTKPPSRYTQASLIKKLESEEIGRPSTYASILDRLFAQEYIAEEKNKLKSMERGNIVRDALVSRFSFVEYEYTREMEQGLDDITEGKADYLSLVSGADKKLDAELQVLGSVKLDVAETGEPCPKDGCEGRLRLKKSKKGSFWGCSNYPDCSFTVDDKSGKPDFQSLEAHPCPSCEKPMRRRKGSNGSFWGCTGYPDCKQTCPDKNGKPDTEKKEKPKLAVSEEFKCGECESPLIKRPSKKGKGFWWGCSGFPRCKKTYFDEGGSPKYLQS